MLRRFITVLICLTAVFLIVPFISHAEESNGKHYTVTYIIDKKVYWSETILSETLAHLPTDVTSTKTTLPFLYWHEEGTSKPFLSSTLITENITLVAHFSKNHLITFMNNRGVEMDIVEYQPGQVTKDHPYDQQLPLDKSFSYWYLENQPDIPFTFGNVLTENIVLFPQVSYRNAAVFITSGSEIEPQSEDTPFYAVDPLSMGTEINRPGYSFVHWSGEENGAQPFDFEGTPIMGTVNIYAVWQAEMSGYWIDFWNEKADISDPGDPADPACKENYELVYSRYIGEGALSGSDATVSEEQANSLYPDGGTEVLKLLNYSDYVYSDTKRISGTGTTTINVYYKRTVYEYNFDPRNVGKWTTADTIYVPSAYIILRDGTQYGGIREDGTSGLPLPYTIHVKLGQNIRALWPVVTGRTDSGAVFQIWNSYYGNGAEALGVNHISFAMTPNNDSTVKPETTSVNMGIDSKNWLTKYYTEKRNYFIQNLDDNADLPGTVAFTTKTTKRAYEDSGKTHYYTLGAEGILTYQSGNPLTNATGWPGRDIPGFVTITATNTDKVNNLTQYYQEVLPYTPTDTVNYYINYYMCRKSYTLTLKINDTTEVKKVLQYEAPLELPPPLIPDSPDFIGWYQDDLLTIPCNLTTMPARDLTLYAAYKGEIINVNYFEDCNKIKTQEYQKDEVITFHDLSGTPYADYKPGQDIPGKGIFQGWYYQVGSLKIYVPFPLQSRLNRESYDLYAKWQEVDYTVTYMVESEEYCKQTILSGAYNTLALGGLHEPIPPVRENYRFLGWNTNPDGSGEWFTASTRIVEDQVVYAMWEDKSTCLFQNDKACNIIFIVISGFILSFILLFMLIWVKCWRKCRRCKCRRCRCKRCK